MKLITRRHFLRSIALTGMALGTTRCALHSGSAESWKWKPRQCLSSVMFSSLSLAAFCAKAAELGFKGIDLWAPFGKCEHMEQARKMGAPAFLKLLHKHDLKVGAWTVYSSKQYKERFAGYADFIGKCGGGIVVFGTSFEEEDKQDIEKSLPKYLESLRPEVELARQHKVTFAVENHSYSIFNSLRSFEIFHAHNPDPEVVGIALAPYHIQAHKISVLDAIAACRGKMRFFYAWQDAKGAKQLPGKGPTDFTPWLKALKKEGYAHWMTPFMHGELPTDEMTRLVSDSKHYLEALEI